MAAQRPGELRHGGVTGYGWQQPAGQQGTYQLQPQRGNIGTGTTGYPQQQGIGGTAQSVKTTATTAPVGQQGTGYVGQPGY